MKKSAAIALYGGQVKDLAGALHRSAQAVSQWGEELSDPQAKEIIGDAVQRFGVRRVRLAFPGLYIPYGPPPPSA